MSNMDESTIDISYKLTNNSNYDGEEVAQLYFRDSYSSVTRPVKELLSYKRVFLKSKESKELSFKIPLEELAFYDINMNYCVEEGNFEFMVGGSSKTHDLILDSLFVQNRLEYK